MLPFTCLPCFTSKPNPTPLTISSPIPLTLPTSTSTLPSQPFPDAPIQALILSEYDSRDFGKSSDALADWLNARWKKTGYEVSREVVYCFLRIHGREVYEGRGDHLDGRFQR
ncbi:hypothetical protein EJ08DRAFT_697964 [Tothia fuscella]|uniref:Uncharacterized protein n=1 Tax=Tothia fuscella TaxID=1048955 RepID=A0A9P4NQ00_9PEZI|nr:hypothetical protein EJ08DRAFT_697964 [Tothia fuscella]